MTTTAYTVAGMTCGHRVCAVSAEISKLPGVQDIAVDLATGTVTVTSERPVDPQAIHAAVDEAGYGVANNP